MKIRSIFTILVFGLIILFFSVNQLYNFIPDLEYNENKQKAARPVIDINYLDPYPGLFEAYLSDNFSLRGHFLKIMGNINLIIWKKSPKPKSLIIGKNNWLFGVYKQLDYYLGKSNYTEEQLNIILNEFKYRKQLLDNMGIQMALVLNPSKYAIYPEYLPNYIVRNNTKNATEKLIDFFNENSDINVIYPKKCLLIHKNDHQLYYKGDTHWNFIAGYFAGRNIVENLYLNKSIPIIEFNEFCIDTSYNYKGNLANMTADASQFSEASYDFKLCENDAEEFIRYIYPPPEKFKWEYQKSFRSNNSNLPNALIFRDSFGWALIPYLKNSFYCSTFIFDSWTYGFNLEIIKQEKPDIVIFMAVETWFSNILKEGLTEIEKERTIY